MELKKTITSSDLQDLHRRLCDEGRKLMERKNADYKAGSGDPFANFRMAALLHVNPAIGAMVRMQDKMARLVSFIETGKLAVAEESWHDCIVDLINYSVILHGLLSEQTGAGEAGKSCEDETPELRAAFAKMAEEATRTPDTITIKDLVMLAHSNALAHGFWDEEEHNMPEKLALIHSEISEALEDYRAGKSLVMIDINEKGKPEGFPTELADAVIRVADLCGHLGIDLADVILRKMKYNLSRPRKHGKVC